MHAEHQLGDFSTKPLHCRDPSGSKIKQEGKKARRNSSILSPRGRRPAGGLYTLFHFTPASALPDGWWMGTYLRREVSELGVDGGSCYSPRPESPVHPGQPGEEAGGDGVSRAVWGEASWV